MIYLGEWIESHALHISMLHAPDFLGYEDAIQLARDHREEVERGFRLKRLGNDIIRLIGGREIHPVNCRVGGFYRTPSREDLDGLVERLARGVDDALETVRWTSGFHVPDFEQDYEFVCLAHPEEYPLLDGRIISSKGLNVSIPEFQDVIREEQVAYSTALHTSLKSACLYLTGPMARFNLNFELLSPVARRAAEEAGLLPVCFNPFRSIVIRSVELVHACAEILSLTRSLSLPKLPHAEAVPRPGVGFGCTEAPRGLCWHRYVFDGNGDIAEARIIPPTAQNQKIIECDLMQFAESNRILPHDRLLRMCELAIRNHDPCISCSCH